MFEFNLVEEKWLPCVMHDNSLKDLSLRGVLTNATEIRELVGDSPPVTIALHRLLLAILHRALNAPQSYEDWNDYWQAKSWNNEEKLDKYLDDWKHRFDLFDEKRPFYQASYLKEYLKQGEIITLYFHNSSTLFEHSNRFNAVLPPANVARLLIGFQAFDVGGLKTYINKTDKSANASPLIQSAVSLIRGESLFDTLMLNWHQYNENDEQPFKFRYVNDIPGWEKDSETKAGERHPDGYVDLLTWQSRSILLQPEKDEFGKTVVRNGVVMKGFQFPSSFIRKDKETMVTFVKKDDKSPYLPLRFNEDKALWRDSLAILKTISEKQTRPKMFEWLNELANEGFLNRSSVFPIDFYGLSANQAKLLFWQQDKFNVPLAYLNDNDLLNDLKNAIQFSEDISRIIYLSSKSLASILLAPNSDKENGNQPDPKSVSSLIQSFSVESKYWSNLETQFQKLLLDLPNDKEKALSEWFDFVEKQARQAFDDTANSLRGSATEQKAFVEGDKTYRIQKHILLHGSKKKQGNSKYRRYLLNENMEVNQ